MADYPERIVSTVPSQTELLHSLGLNSEVVGITKFCVHPNSWFRNKTRVGGTKELKLSRIRQLQPDLIICNKEENEKSDIEELKKEFPVWVSDVTDLDSAIVMIDRIGKITRREKESIELINQINNNFNSLQQFSGSLSVVYLIWKNPYMTVGSDTFIHNMLCKIGLKNVFSNSFRYPETTIEEIVSCKPNLVFLSSEPYPFNQKDINHFQLNLPDSNVILVDGEYFSWYGSRLEHAPDYFSNLLKSLKIEQD